MEEDIKILETFKYRKKTKNYNKITLEDIQAIENLIKGYKELQEKIDDLLSQNEMFKDMYDEEVYKNKELEKENQSYREKIKEIEENDKKYKNYLKDGRENFTPEYVWVRPYLQDLLEEEQ